MDMNNVLTHSSTWAQTEYVEFQGKQGVSYLPLTSKKGFRGFFLS